MSLSRETQLKAGYDARKPSPVAGAKAGTAAPAPSAGPAPGAAADVAAGTTWDEATGTRTRPSRPRRRVVPSETEHPVPSPWNRWLGLAAVLIAGIAIAVAISRPSGDAPDLAAAKAILARYEYARPESERNYRNPIYAEALTLLDKIEPQSASGPEAQALAIEVRKRIEEFARRSEKAEQQAQVGAEQRMKRDEEFIEAQHRAALTPVTSFPECEHEHVRKGRAVHVER